MTEEQIKDYVSKNCCDLCDNRKWCSIQNECFVVNAITEATKELENKLSEATEIIKNIVRVTWGEGWNYSLDWKVKAEKFLEEEK